MGSTNCSPVTAVSPATFAPAGPRSPWNLSIGGCDRLQRLAAREGPSVSAFDTREPAVIARRADLSAYDATCVALAEALGVQLVTADGRLGRASDDRCTITVASR